jgi:hypothetical protein
MATQHKEEPKRADRSERDEDSGAAKQLKARQDQEANAIVGKDTGKTIQQQTKEARGEEGEEGDKKNKAIRDYSDGADKEAEKILEEAYPERKAIDLRVESRRKFNEKFGIDPNRADRILKVEISDKVKGEKLYKGRLTLHSVHGETHEKLSFPCHEDVARGEDYLFYVMKNAHPHAMREHFEIDAENTSDPNLRSRYE